MRCLAVADEEHHLGPAASPEANPVAVRQRPFRHLIAVNIGSVTGRAILENESAVGIDDDFGMIPRDFAAGEAQVVGLAPTDFKRSFRQGYHAPAERVGDFEAGLRHAPSVPQPRRRRRAIRIKTPTAAKTTAATSSSLGYPDA